MKFAPDTYHEILPSPDSESARRRAGYVAWRASAHRSERRLARLNTGIKRDRAIVAILRTAAAVVAMAMFAAAAVAMAG